MGKTTSAERMRKFRQKLKDRPEDFKNHLQREKERDKKRREKRKEKEKLSKRLLNERRGKEAERKRQYRERKKLLTQSTLHEHEQSSSSLGSYCCVQTLGKAVSRVRRTLPSSPRKKFAVVRKLGFDIFGDVARVINESDKKRGVKHALSEEDKEIVKNFYQRDDVSRQAPGIKDVKSVKDTKTGERILCQKRYMNMTVREAYSLFTNDNPDVNIKMAKFYELRPPYVLLTSELPHNTCVCKYHANFNYLVESIAKKIPDFPATGGDLLEKSCCDVKSEQCMLGDCSQCISDLHVLLGNTNDLYQSSSWKKWVEIEGRPKVVTLEGTIEEALEELNDQLHRFKIHVYVKRVQSDIFIEAKRSVQSDEAILQIDFAENYALITQDEIQSAHWSHKQITVFTACAWLAGGKRCSFAIVSDVLRHDKYAVFACLKKIIMSLTDQVQELKTIKIFSDGAASQFKNRFTLSNLCFMPKDFGVQGEWNFFATSHGKGAVDGVGAVVKRAVWSQVKQRKAEINDARDFVWAASNVVKNINIMHLSEDEIDANRVMLDNRWDFALGINKVQSHHYFKGYNQEDLIMGLTFKSKPTKCTVFKLNPAQIYSDTDTSLWSDSDCEPLAFLIHNK